VILLTDQDCTAYKLQGSEHGWQLAGALESRSRPGLPDGREESALNMFKQMDLKGKVKDDTKLDTVHQNTITKIRVYEGSPGRVTKFSSESSLGLGPQLTMTASGVDGRVVIWTV
jgi:actin related protein 2/3 complex subunit 1A/1B